MMVSDIFLFAFFLLLGSFIFVLGEFIRQIVEEREYREWEKRELVVDKAFKGVLINHKQDGTHPGRKKKKAKVSKQQTANNLWVFFVVIVVLVVVCLVAAC